MRLSSREKRRVRFDPTMRGEGGRGARLSLIGDVADWLGWGRILEALREAEWIVTII